MNFSTNAPPKTTARLLSSCRRSGLTAIVFQSSSTKNAVKMKPRSPVAGVNSMNICADARSSDTSTIAPDACSRVPTVDRRAGDRGSSAPDRTSVAISRTPRTSAINEGGTSESCSGRGHAQAADSCHGQQQHRQRQQPRGRPAGPAQSDRERGSGPAIQARPADRCYRERARSVTAAPGTTSRIQIGQIARQPAIEFRRKFLGGVQLEAGSFTVIVPSGATCRARSSAALPALNSVSSL